MKITIDKALIEQAIDALGNTGTVSSWQRNIEEEVIQSLRAALVEPAVEPVCHQYQCTNGEWYPFINEKHYANTVADGSWPIRALYASPPDNVSLLTDEEIENVIAENAGYGGSNLERVARAIEAAARQKAGL